MKILTESKGSRSLSDQLRQITLHEKDGRKRLKTQHRFPKYFKPRRGKNKKKKRDELRETNEDSLSLSSAESETESKSKKNRECKMCVMTMQYQKSVTRVRTHLRTIKMMILKQKTMKRAVITQNQIRTLTIARLTGSVPHFMISEVFKSHFILICMMALII